MSLKIAVINSTMITSLSKIRMAPMRCITVLAIANRLSAHQALGDMVERVARVWE